MPHVMPIYVYRIIRPVEQPEETFEMRQSIHDAPLTVHPETGEPVERVLTAPMISVPLGDSQIRNSGLKKFTKTSDGSYERMD